MSFFAKFMSYFNKKINMGRTLENLEENIGKEQESTIQNFVVVDKNSNQSVLSVKEINGENFFENSNIPSNTVKRFQHLASDSLKGITGIPNTTIEIVFKPDIMEKLKDGSYKLMKTKTGETLADAVNKNGTIVGKGRITEVGKIKQLCGAGFQMLSIAVAQSHLADINNRLECIEKSCDEIKQTMNDDKLSKVQGDVSYLQILFDEINNKEDFSLSVERSNQIESVIRDLLQYNAEIMNDFKRAIDGIKNQKDKDFFGSGDTYNELNQKIEKIRDIIKRKSAIENLVILLKYIVAIIDPYQKNYTTFNKLLIGKDWSDLSHSFITSVREQVEKLITAKFNDVNVLKVRKEKLISNAEIYQNQLEMLKSKSDYALLNLEHSLSKLTNLNGNLRYALSFDETGNVQKVNAIYNSNSI